MESVGGVKMVSCEKCWIDAGGDSERYNKLVEQRNLSGDLCSPEEQAGLDATECEFCGRRTVHQCTDVCVVCGKPDWEF